MRLIGAVGVKVRPDATDFRDEAERDIKNQLRGFDSRNSPAKVKLRTDFDEDQLRRDFNRHRDTLKSMVEGLNRDLESDKLRLSFDKSSFKPAYAEFRKMRDNYSRMMEVMRDEVTKLENKLKGAKDNTGTFSFEWLKVRNDLRKTRQATVDESARMQDALRSQRENVLFEYRAWGKRLFAEQSRIEANGFRDMSKKLKSIKADLDRVSPLSTYVEDLRARGVRGSALRRELGDISGAMVKAVGEARRFRREWDRLAEEEKDALKLRVTIDDNDAIEEERRRIADLRKEIGSWNASYLRRSLVQAREDVSRDLDLFEEEFQRRLNRFRNGGAPGLEPVSNETLQVRDNRRILAQYEEGLRRAREKAEETRDYIDKLNADIEVGANTTSARAKLRLLTRPRIVPLHVRVSNKSLAIAEGTLKSLAGYNVLSSFGNTLSDLLQSYDKFTLKWAGLVTLFGNISNSVVGAVASIASVGKGAVQVLQGLAMGPTVLGAIGTTATVATVALKDFFGALASGDTSKLTSPNAIANVERLKGTWTELSTAIKDGFWANAGTGFADFILKAMPTLSRGLGESAQALGTVWSNLFDSLVRSFDRGHFDRMFDGLSETLREASQAVDPLIQGIMTLGARGAEHLPRLGRYVTQVAEGFERWIDAADKSGQIDKWIDNAAQSFQDFTKVGRGVFDMLVGVADAALKAGGPTFTQFADATLRWGEAMRSVRAQDIMSELFAGAFEGLRRVGPGLQDLFTSLGNNVDYIRRMESAVGGVAGALASNLSTVIDNSTFREGTVTALEDIRTALTRLRPAFDGMGRVIGNFSRLAGAVFKGIAPTLDGVVGLIGDVSDRLVGPLVEAVPKITSSMSSLVNTISGPARAASSALGGVVSAFNALPSAAQSGLLTLGSLIALRPHLRAFGDTITGGVLPAYTKLGAAARELQDTYRAQGRDVSLTTAAYRAFKSEMDVARRFADGLTRSLESQIRVQEQAARNPLLPAARVRESEAAVRSLRTELESTRALMASPVGVGASTADRLWGTNFSGVVQGVRGVRTEWGRMVEQVSAARSVMDSGLRPWQKAQGVLSAAGKGLGGVARSAGSAVKALGGTAGKGLAAAATGIVGAFGGPWGLAITGAVVGLSALASQAADAKNRVLEFQATLTKTGQVTSDTYELQAQRASESYGIWKAGWEGRNESILDTAEKIGVSSSTVIRAMNGEQDALDEVNSKVDEYTKTHSRLVNERKNGTREIIADEKVLKAFSDKVSKANEENKKAIEKQIETAKALGLTSAQFARMGEALGSFQTSVKTANVDAKQLLSTVDLLNDSQLQAADSAFNYYTNLDKMGDALKQWGDANKGNMKKVTDGLFNAQGQFDMTKKSTRDLYSILRSQVEPAFQMVSDTFNRFGGGAEGLKQAQKVMQGVRDDLFKQLTEVVGLSKDKANQILDNLNIKPDDIELLLDADNADKTLREILTELKKLNGETVDFNIQSNALEQKGQINALKGVMDKMVDKNFDFSVQVESGDLVQVMGQIDNAKEQAAATEIVTKFSAQDNVTGMLQYMKGLVERGWDGKQYTAVMDALDQASGVADTVKDQILASYVQGDYTAVLDLVNNAQGVPDDVKNKLLEVVGREWQAQLKVEDKGSDKAKALQDALNALPPEVRTALGLDAGAAQGQLNAFKDGLGSVQPYVATNVVATVSGTGDVQALNSGVGLLPSSKGVAVTAHVSGTADVNVLDASVAGLTGKSVTAQAKSVGRPGVVALDNSIRRTAGKNVRVESVTTGQGAVDSLHSAIGRVQGKHVTVSASASGVGGVRALYAAIKNVNDKTVTVKVVSKRVSIPVADGGVFDTVAFSNGGFMPTVSALRMDNRLRFLAENHVAQIAPAGAYRLWAEQETGGEAYIPLAQAKRTRSEQILAEVANRFGGEYRRFANGSSGGSGSRSTTAYAGDTYNVTVNSVKSDVAGEVSSEVMSTIRHLKRGGYVGA